VLEGAGRYRKRVHDQFQVVGEKAFPLLAEPEARRQKMKKISFIEALLCWNLLSVPVE
jgi:hypothetical protein